jgi:hypothetical protein
MQWDIHEASAPYESDRWASSDRGWLFGCERCKTSLGHYLDYGQTSAAGHPDGDVHAVLIHHHEHGGRCLTRTAESRHFRTPAQARAWLENVSGAQQAFAI